MKLRAQKEGLAVPATVVTANLPKDTLVSITGNRTVDKAGANAHAVGRLVVPSRTAAGRGTVETRYKELIEIKAANAVTAGQLVKMAAADGTTGENRVDVWVSGTDGAERIFGVCWNGGAGGATLEVLTF